MTTLPIVEDFDNADYDPFAAEDMIFGNLTDMHDRIIALRKGSAKPEAGSG